MNKFIFSLLVTLYFNPLAWAQTSSSTLPEPKEATTVEQQKPHIGARLGIASPEGGYGGAAEYGLEVGFQPYIPYGAAVEITNFTSDKNEGDLNRTKVLARGTYNFGGTNMIVRHSYVGLGLGPVFDTVPGDSDVRLGTDLQAGIDFPLNAVGLIARKSMSLGATANYLFVSNSGVDTFGVNGLLKYWF